MDCLMERQMASLMDLQVAIENSSDGQVRIEAGQGGDREAGRAWIVSPDRPLQNVEYGGIAVAWDSGVTTVLPRDETDIAIL
jgi:hypothetical protein